MKISIVFECDTKTKVCRVLSRTPHAPFGICEDESVLHNSHNSEAAKKEMNRAIRAALEGNLPAITVARMVALLLLSFWSVLASAQSFTLHPQPRIKITPAEVREAQLWLGPQMTAAELFQFKAWQDRMRAEYQIEGRFWVDVNRNELVPLAPRAEQPWECKEVATCR